MKLTKREVELINKVRIRELKRFDKMLSDPERMGEKCALEDKAQSETLTILARILNESEKEEDSNA